MVHLVRRFYHGLSVTWSWQRLAGLNSCLFFFFNYVWLPQAVCSGGRQQQHRRHKPDDHQFRGAIFQERCSQGGHGPEQGLGCSGPPAGSLSCWLLGPPLSHHVEGGGEQWQGLISGPPNRNRIIALHRLPTSPPYSPTWF